MTMSMAAKQSVLVLIVAYEAAETIQKVLARIPASVHDTYDVQILILDDASIDRTAETARQFRESNPHLRIEVLRNRVNQGYGGNQKVGYTYAISRGFDFVVMVHGDGQYAPEELPNLLEPLRLGRADAVFGSRILIPGAALHGGMPLYKFVGNRILSTLQNLILRTSLSEFHSGYRAYSVKALESVRFRLNTNDFHFDTEIILQFMVAGLHIEEVPIPTYYGDEISRVNGIPYAINVVIATVRAALHRSGLLFRRRLQPESGGNDHYTLKLGYPSSHTLALDTVRPGSSVIDLGAGPGGLARHLAAKGCEVTVVDQFEPMATPAGVSVRVQDLDQELTFRVSDFDFILLLDVIEHLKSPEVFLERLRQQFDYRSRTLVLTTPNVAFIVQRLTLLLGSFNYGESGILDMTHTRLFTFKSLKGLLDDAGFEVKEWQGIPAPFPKALGDNVVSRLLVRLNLILIKVRKTLFAYQIFVVAESRPDADFVIRDGVEGAAR